MTARARTKRQNEGLASRTSRVIRTSPRRTLGASNSRQPATAAQAGLTSSDDVTTKPVTVAARIASAYRGAVIGASGTGAAVRGRSRRKNQRNPSHSSKQAISHGTSISPANRPNDRPLAAKARRLVRFETGSSREPLLASRLQA